MSKLFVYLAAPYSHEDPKVMEARFHAINKQAARLMSEGYIVHSPISQNANRDDASLMSITPKIARILFIINRIDRNKSRFKSP